MRPALRLRGHHLLCLLGYRGLGYSRAFVRNMDGVAKDFFSARGLEVELVEGPDDICGACPHLAARECRSSDAEALGARDAGALRLLGLKAGERRLNSALRERLRDKASPEALRRVCAGCGWLAAGACGKPQAFLGLGRGFSSSRRTRARRSSASKGLPT